MARKELSDEQVRSTILDKLARKRKWKASHIPQDTIIKWVSNKIKRNGRRVEKLLNDLIRNGFIISKPTHYGVEISLNPERSQEILKIIERL